MSALNPQFSSRVIQETAQRFGTPTYLYDETTLRDNFLAWHHAPSKHPALICFAVKANSNIAVLQLLAKLGAGFDIVSLGELERVLHAGGQPDRIVFSGVGKSREAIARALEVGIKCFNVESLRELEHINQVASATDQIANVSLRINPDVDAKTHPYISTGLKSNKFGIGHQQAVSAYERAAALSHLNIVGIDCHIGSQITTLSPFLESLERLLDLIDLLAAKGIVIHHLDLGGGLGICYSNEQAPSPQAYVEAVSERLGDRDLELVFEPGRSIVANAGVLITEVMLTKENTGKHFAVVDAAMNDLLRPALYQGYHQITVLRGQRPVAASRQHWDIVGPVCETGDFLGVDRELELAEQDLLVIHSVGAYGFSMSSNYNSRPKSAEVLLRENQLVEIRSRETIANLFAHEHLLAE